MLRTDKLTLRPYQKRAVDRLKATTSLGLLIHGDMGVGKTPITCTYLEHTGASALISTTKSGVAVWLDHIRDWAPSLKPVFVMTNTSDRIPVGTKVVIMNHDKIIRPGVKERVIEFTKRRRTIAILDESQYFKNEEARRRQTIIPNCTHNLWRSPRIGSRSAAST